MIRYIYVDVDEIDKNGLLFLDEKPPLVIKLIYAKKKTKYNKDFFSY